MMFVKVLLAVVLILQLVLVSGQDEDLVFSMPDEEEYDEVLPSLEPEEEDAIEDSLPIEADEEPSEEFSEPTQDDFAQPAEIVPQNDQLPSESTDDKMPEPKKKKFNWKSKDSYKELLHNFSLSWHLLLDLLSNDLQPHFMQVRHPRRSWKDELLYGLSEGMFKLQPRLSTNCFTEGKTWLVALKRVTIAFIKSGSLSGQDEFNFEDQSQNFFRRCNLLDTVPAAFILNFLINRIDALPVKVGHHLALVRLVLKMLDINGLIQTFMELAYSADQLMNRISTYQHAKALGKVIKLCIQFYMWGTFGNLLQSGSSIGEDLPVAF